MRHLVVLSDGTVATDVAVEEASRITGAEGTLVLICVLPGSLIDRSLPPADRGRERRAAVDDASRRLNHQAARLALRCEVHAVALFGDEADDTMLLAANLGADGVVIATSSPAMERLVAECPVPVVAVPGNGASAAGVRDARPGTAIQQSPGPWVQFGCSPTDREEPGVSYLEPEADRRQPVEGSVAELAGCVPAGGSASIVEWQVWRRQWPWLLSCWGFQ